MNDAFRMGCFKRVGDVQSKCEVGRQIKRAPRNLKLQCSAVQVFHHDEYLSVILPNVINRTNVWVVQGGSGFGLTPKTFQRLTVLGQILRQEFQGDKTVEPSILGL